MINILSQKSLATRSLSFCKLFKGTSFHTQHQPIIINNLVSFSLLIQLIPNKLNYVDEKENIKIYPSIHGGL
jgi:hypothetical protein